MNTTSILVEAAYSAYISANPEFDTDLLRYSYTSLTTPSSTYDYNMISREKTLKKQQEVVGGHDPGDYITERIYADSRDGKKVPISLVYRKGFEKNERGISFSTPTALTAARGILPSDHHV